MYDNDQNYGWKSYDNQSYDNRQYGGDPYGRRPQPEEMPPKKKKGGILKKAALITAGALLFGTVSGATMVGVNVLHPDSWETARLHRLKRKKRKRYQRPRQKVRAADRITARAAPRVTADTSRARGTMERQWRMCPILWKQAMPTVVAITSTAVYQSNNYGYGWFFRGGPETYEVPSSGSGNHSG
mgnify:CR=1 FL=1